MRIQWVPAGTEAHPSSRIRVYRVNAALQGRAGIESVIGSEITRGADVCVLQKVVDAGIISRAREMSRVVLVDLDDPTKIKKYADSLKVADAVSTNNVGVVRGIERDFGLTAHIVPDCVDYVSSPMPLVNTSQKVAWFGSPAMLAGALPLLRKAREAGFDVTTIGKQFCTSEFRRVDWSLETFPSELRKCGTSLLSHRGYESRRKSPHRIVASIMIGVPAIMVGSQSAEFLEDASGARVSATDEGDAIGLLRRLQIPSERERQIGLCQKFAVDNLVPGVIAGRLLRVFEWVLAERG